MLSCWDEVFSYEKCCLGDQTPIAALSSTTQTPGHISDVNLEQVADSPPALDLEASRKKMRQLKGRLFGLERRLRPLEHGGPRWLTLAETCVQKQLDGKEYKICFFGDAKQGSVSLGSFEGWDTAASNELVLRFTQGQRCPAGPTRSLKVRLTCGSQNDLIDISEPSLCTYQAVATSPNACELEDAQTVDHESIITPIMPHDEL